MTQTQNPLLNTIFTLTDLLREQTHNVEAGEKATNAAVDLSAELTTELHRMGDECDRLTRRLRDTEETLSYARQDAQRARDSVGKGYMWDAFMANPERVMAGIMFLRGSTNEMRANKIALIKSVRELTFFGLKEAKDMVESFLANPTVAPSPATVDPNPCTDSSLRARLQPLSNAE